MSVAPETLEVGQCYLAKAEKDFQVRRVLRVMPDGRVQFERRIRNAKGPQWSWVPKITSLGAFALSVERPVPCDWAPEADG